MANITLVGRLTKDPEVRYTQNQTAVCAFTVAEDRGRDKDALFVDVKCFGKQAEFVEKWFTKGKPIYVAGDLDMDKWETDAGEKKSRYYVRGRDVKFLPSSKSDEKDVRKFNANGEQASISNTGSFTSFDESDIPFE